MTTTPGSPDGFGFKRMTIQNWLIADSVWQNFAHPPFVDPATAWADAVLKYQLARTVPQPLREMFEVARGALVYGLLFYPLLTIGTDQLFRVLEAALDAKCKALHAPARERTFSKKLCWVRAVMKMPKSESERWDTARLLRNRTTHACDQHIHDPTTALNVLRLTVELIDRLFPPG